MLKKTWISYKKHEKKKTTSFVKESSEKCVFCQRLTHLSILSKDSWKYVNFFKKLQKKFVEKLQKKKLSKNFVKKKMRKKTVILSKSSNCCQKHFLSSPITLVCNMQPFLPYSAKQTNKINKLNRRMDLKMPVIFL